MRTTPTLALVTSALLLGTLAARPLARDKEQQQLAADIRIMQVMMQEQSQQLQAMLAQMNEALKAANQRLDDQSKASQRSFADQKLVIDTLQKDLSVLREKVDDSNTRLGSVSQELEALRQGVQQALQAPPPAAAPPPPVDGADAAAPGNGLVAAAPPPSPAPPLAVGTSPNRLYDMAWSNYTSGLWDLTIDGFQAFIRSFPKSDKADDAQVYIGNAYLNDGKNDKAVEAYDLAIRTYPTGDAIPEAYYKKGLALKSLRQIDLARQAWEYVVKTYPDSTAALLARQQIQQLTTIPPR
jgi:tol-pal system protein YbgF